MSRSTIYSCDVCGRDSTWIPGGWIALDSDPTEKDASHLKIASDPKKALTHVCKQCRLLITTPVEVIDVE